MAKAIPTDPERVASPGLLLLIMLRHRLWQAEQRTEQRWLWDFSCSYVTLVNTCEIISPFCQGSKWRLQVYIFGLNVENEAYSPFVSVGIVLFVNQLGFRKETFGF